jgi:branched-chain amino acid transport system permease protein
LAAIFGGGMVYLASALGLEGLYLTTFTLIVFEFAKSVVIGTKSLGGNEGLLYFNFDENIARNSAYAFIALVLLAIGVNHAVLSSSLGLKWLAVKDDETAAAASGVFGRREKVTAYVISGALTTFGGAAQAFYLGYAQPDTSLGVGLLISAVIAVYIGGPGTLMGPLFGVIVIFGLDALARNLSSDIQVSLYAQVTQYSLAFVVFWVLSTKAFANFSLSSLIKNLFVKKAKFESSNESGLISDKHEEIVKAPKAQASTSNLENAMEVTGITKNFGGARVLEGVTFSIKPGEIVGLIGPNGAGKTTLCNVIAGVYKPDTGDVTLGGVSLLPMSTPERFKFGVARTFQAARVFPSLTVEQNIRLTVKNQPERVAELLQQFGLPGKQDSKDSPMFVRRLTEIARAIASPKKVLILDEPLAGLTPTQHELVLKSVQAVAATGTAVIIVEHLIQTVAKVCDRLIVLSNGALIADGPAALVLKDELVVGAYLGKSMEQEA